MANPRIRLLASVAAIVLTRASVHAACDVAGVDAAAIAATRAAMDAACPCAAATNRPSYRACAGQVVRVRVAASQLTTGCRREALRHAKLSICGRPGTAVCCRVAADGRTRHRIVADAAACVGAPHLTSCVSTWQSIPMGCDAAGCVPPPVCGNFVVEPGEDCDPPDLLSCDASCRAITCDLPPSDCGDGTIEAGETCDPPGVGGCGRDCQLAPCAAPSPGEIGIACVTGGGDVGVGATSDRYLVAWSGQHRRETSDILVRRFDVDGAPVDAALTVASDDAPCGTNHSGPAVGSDGVGFHAVWSGLTLLSNTFFEEWTFARRIDAGASMASLASLDSNTPFGQCHSSIFGPTMVAGVSPSRFAVGWHAGAFCLFGGLIATNPVGEVLQFDPTSGVQSVPLGFPIAPPPNYYSTSAASVASLDGDTLWAWQAGFASSSSGGLTSYFLWGAWTDAGGTSAGIVTDRPPSAATRPSVAAGAASLLAAWGQSVAVAGTPTEIRAIRVTRAAGNLDPAGGLLLATAPTQVTGGPVAAFDGSRWLVVWAEASAATHDLRALAVRDDGTVVDAAPRLVATNVRPSALAVASVGDGRVLVVFGRPDGSSTAVRATLVSP
jgi:hypothetical protein